MFFTELPSTNTTENFEVRNFKFSKFNYFQRFCPFYKVPSNFTLSTMAFSDELATCSIAIVLHDQQNQVQISEHLKQDVT